MNTKTVTHNENFDKPSKDFVIFTWPKLPCNFDEIDISTIPSAGQYGTPMSDDRVISTEIWAAPVDNSSLVIWRITVVNPAELTSWNDYQISAYVKKIIEYCSEFNKVANLLPIFAQDNAETIFNDRSKQVEMWLLKIRREWREYLDIDDEDGKPRTIGFK